MENILLNFGVIRDSALKLSAAELLKGEQSKTLSKLMEEVAKSPALKKQFLFYKNIQEAKPFTKDRLAERVIAQNLSMFQTEDWNKILQENRVLRKELLEDYHVQAQKSEDAVLYESINTLIEATTNKNFKEFEKELNAYETIINHLTRPVISESDGSKEKDDAPDMIKNAWKFITETAISNFNERYEHLTEDEKRIFKILISEADVKRTYFQELKSENINLISEKMKEETNGQMVSILEGFKQKLESLDVTNTKDIDACILSCFELKDSLK